MIHGYPKKESTFGVAPDGGQALKFDRIDGITGLPSLAREPRFSGHVDYRWWKDDPEPADFIAVRRACLDGGFVDATDTLLGALRVRVTEFRMEYTADRMEWTARVWIEGYRPATPSPS